MFSMMEKKQERGLMAWLHDQTIRCMDEDSSNATQWGRRVATSISCTSGQYFEVGDLATSGSSRAWHLDLFTNILQQTNVFLRSVWLRVTTNLNVVDVSYKKLQVYIVESSNSLARKYL